MRMNSVQGWKVGCGRRGLVREVGSWGCERECGADGERRGQNQQATSEKDKRMTWRCLSRGGEAAAGLAVSE